MEKAGNNKNEQKKMKKRQNKEKLFHWKVDTIDKTLTKLIRDKRKNITNYQYHPEGSKMAT